MKIESTGLAHTKNKWRELTASELSLELMTAFVTYVGQNGRYYTCGMHIIGFRDTTVEADIDGRDAANLLYQLNKYVLLEEPTINDGETFSLDEDAPRYRIYQKPCDQFPPDDLFHNPYGIWQLVPA